ncbi:hypothetical protein [Actinoplanes derwentensis]|uniref:Uncharacterized protein n=1 Tax=Actinoplanes derwentensis TaxID=113562 RepID=A0A1H1RUD0_9ACTN|nr:hypothetical protein [Actinoplanes derwentensis]GID84524.1 hypothetical protein Ade03nite_34480 [Actinoplanes derwentensis]SDS39347.1 hypothetical protein SAMN04489716_0688 [Actinoplanes derwentensis]
MDDNRPAWQLGHLLEKRPEAVEEPPQYVERWFALHPLAVDRPAEGKDTVPIVCGTCGGSVDCVVASAALLDNYRAEVRRAKKFRWLALALGIVVGLTAFVTLNAVGPVAGTGWVVALFLITFGGAGVATSAATGINTPPTSRQADGVELAEPSAVHMLRSPGHDRDYSSGGEGGEGGE